MLFGTSIDSRVWHDCLRCPAESPSGIASYDVVLEYHAITVYKNINNVKHLY